jgi:hypothetical protein
MATLAKLRRAWTNAEAEGEPLPLQADRFRALSEASLLHTYLCSPDAAAAVSAVGVPATAVGEARHSDAASVPTRDEQAVYADPAANRPLAAGTAPKRQARAGSAEAVAETVAWLETQFPVVAYLLAAGQHRTAPTPLLCTAAMTLLPPPEGDPAPVETAHPYLTTPLTGTVLVPSAHMLRLTFLPQFALTPGDDLVLLMYPPVAAEDAAAALAAPLPHPTNTLRLHRAPHEQRITLSTNFMRYELLPRPFNERVHEGVRVRHASGIRACHDPHAAAHASLLVQCVCAVSLFLMYVSVIYAWAISAT